MSEIVENCLFVLPNEKWWKLERKAIAWRFRNFNEVNAFSENDLNYNLKWDLICQWIPIQNNHKMSTNKKKICNELTSFGAVEKQLVNIFQEFESSDASGRIISQQK